MSLPTTERSPVTMPLRIFAGTVGAVIIGCVTWGAVSAVGGINTPTGPTLVALAFGLVAGAMCAGFAWHNGRKTMAIALGLALLMGEAYALLNTGERELEARDAKQAPVRVLMADRERLSREAQAPVVTTTPRLQAAMANLDAVNTDARVKIATPSCVKLCKQELTEQREAAQKEVADARAELYALRKASSENVDATKVALAAIPAAAAVSPLAARINVADWILDLIRAGLYSVAANGLGAFLLAFASSRGKVAKIVEAKALVAETAPVEAPKALTFEGPLTEDEIEELKRILGKHRELCNKDLASAVGVSAGEMSRRVPEYERLGLVASQKVGKEKRIRLVSNRAA